MHLEAEVTFCTFYCIYQYSSWCFKALENIYKYIYNICKWHFVSWSRLRHPVRRVCPGWYTACLSQGKQLLEKFDSNTNYLKHLVAWFIAAEYNFQFSFCPEETECLDFFALLNVVYSNLFPQEKILLGCSAERNSEGLASPLNYFGRPEFAFCHL